MTLTEIEYAAWFDDEAARGRSAPTDVGAAARLVAAMRAEGIVTFINVVNWNVAVQRCQDDDWFRARVVEIRETIGPDRVILQGVSEPRSTKGECPDHFEKADRWQHIARAEWAGAFAVAGQWPGPRPQTVQVPYDYLDLHYCDFPTMLARMAAGGRDRIHNTDCTPLVAAHLTAPRAARLVRQARRFGTHLLVYDFDRARVDEPLLEAMGAALRAAEGDDAAAPGGPAPFRGVRPGGDPRW
ncbi:MAG: hypothetical protein QN122_13025 [Armatimonadota bacterium]|nr:hypothetical protein [Armatimonadota bacterium]MDR7528901.1 hypothetical protein [Armatimonadota bacterium]